MNEDILLMKGQNLDLLKRQKQECDRRIQWSLFKLNQNRKKGDKITSELEADCSLLDRLNKGIEVNTRE